MKQLIKLLWPEYEMPLGMRPETEVYSLMWYANVLIVLISYYNNPVSDLITKGIPYSPCTVCIQVRHQEIPNYYC